MELKCFARRYDESDSKSDICIPWPIGKEDLKVENSVAVELKG